jgi:hypothetical protein
MQKQRRYWTVSGGRRWAEEKVVLIHVEGDNIEGKQKWS